MTQHLAVKGLTTIYTYASAASGVEAVPFSALTDNIVMLGMELDKDPRRTIRIVKARGVDHDLATRELKITSDGIG